MTDKNDLSRVVFEHNGALGDMLLAWPAAFAFFSHFPHLSRHFRVRSGHAPFFAALGASPCPPGLTADLDALYGAPRWPRALEEVLVLRPGLAARPDIPLSPRFLFAPGVLPGRFDSPRDLYRQALAAHGIPWRDDWPAAFRGLFGTGPAAPPGSASPVLLFPGAGHKKKAWPRKRFLALADSLRRHGLSPLFVLGPAERERGLDVSPWPAAMPPDIPALMALLRTARAAVGPDCGPMHLAGLLGVPGVSIFGPTSPRQWAPLGMAVVTAGRPCSPCVQVTSGDFAPACPTPPPCLTEIGVAKVRAAMPVPARG